jgi:hypothetical protein
MERQKRHEIGGNYVHPETGISHDSINVWAGLSSAAAYAEEPDMFDIFAEQAKEDLPTYEEYIRRVNKDQPEHAEEMLKNTDPAKLKRFNELVAEFNQNRERIVREKDITMAKRICKEAEAVIRGTK